MGEVAIPLALIAGAGAGIAKASAQEEAEKSQLESLRIQSKQNDLRYTQKSIANVDLMTKVLQRQEAQATTRGIALTSPSFNAIQRDTLNTGAKAQQNLDIEKSLMDVNLDIERQNVRDTFAAQLFGDVSDFAFSSMSIYKDMPRGG